jgi:hypothetical protein
MGMSAAHAECKATLSDPTVDFGAMRPGAGADANQIKASPQSRVYSVVCGAPVQMNLIFRGTPSAVAPDTLQFGDAGTYVVRVASARLDGNPVQLARLAAVGQAPGQAATSDLTLQPADVVAPANGQQLLSGSRLDLTLQVSARIPANAVRIAQEVKLNAIGQLTMETR